MPLAAVGVTDNPGTAENVVAAAGAHRDHAIVSHRC
jgi:hypothetical protein